MIDVTALEQLRRYALVDADDSGEMQNLQDAWEAAAAYAQGAGVPESESPLRALLLRKLALYYYECRGPDPRYGYPDPPPDLNALVLQLRNPGATETKGE